MAGFKIGDRVEWESQAAGVVRMKAGEVVEVVPPRTDPKAHGDFGSWRDHESYVVRATAIRNSNRRTKLYWPRVSALRSVGGGEA